MSIKTNLQANNTDLQSLIDQANALPDPGVQLPELTNEGTASDLMAGKELIDSEGNVVTGTAGITATDDGVGTVTLSMTGVTGISIE